VQALADSLSGTNWTPKVDLTTGAPGSNLSAISCTGVSACVAAGSYLDANSHDHALIETLSGTGWASTIGIDPANASAPSFTSASCPDAGNCVAVGNAIPPAGSGVIEPFAATESAPNAIDFQVSAPASASIGRPVTVTVTALGLSGVIASGYTGTVHFTSSDPAAVLPPDSTLSNGSGTFTITLNTSGDQRVTATDTNNPTISGTSGTISVSVVVHRYPPSPPLGLTATAGPGGIGLTWNPPTNDGGAAITGYVILRGTTPGGELPLATTGARSYTDTTVADGVGYYYVVEAVNAVGTSPRSNEVRQMVTGVMSGGRRFAGTPDGHGWWLASSTGGVYPFGNATFHGSLLGAPLNQPIVGIAATPDAQGYWLVASDGGVFAFGDASFQGSLGAIHLNQPIVGITATPDGRGYWLVASDGGIFAFGDAGFWGSLGSLRLNQPIVGMAQTPRGRGYWLVASDGGIFAFGDAGFWGSLGSIPLNQPIVGMAATPDGHGYWMVALDGGVFAFADAPFYGSVANRLILWPILGMVAERSGAGYSLVDASGTGTHFGS
jgi:hypothetical protein